MIGNENEERRKEAERGYFKQSKCPPAAALLHVNVSHSHPCWCAYIWFSEKISLKKEGQKKRKREM